jgi:hypothetical protein
MSRRDRSYASDGEIYAALVALAARLGHNPTPADLNRNKDFPLNASGLRRRFGSLHRALLLASWFRQPHSVPHEPLELGDLTLSSLTRALLAGDHSQVLHLNGLASVEDVLRERFAAGHPIGGMFSPVSEGTPLWHSPAYALWMHASSLQLLAVTASARAYEAIGTLVLENGTAYPEQVTVAMVVIYDLADRGWHFDGRFILPRSFNLDDYVRAGMMPACA